jgi:hypothetical protein
MFVSNSIRSSPFPSSRRAEASRATLAAAGDRPGRSSPLRSIFSRQSPHSLAPNLLRPSTSSAELPPRRNQACRPPAAIVVPPSFPLPSSSPFWTPSAQIDSPVSLLARPSCFPAFSPLESHPVSARAPPRRCECSAAPPPHLAHRPCAGLLAIAERPEAGDPP